MAQRHTTRRQVLAGASALLAAAVSGSAQAAPADWRQKLITSARAQIGIVSDRKAAGIDLLLLIHNIGGGAEESDVLAAYPLTGRFRMAPS